MTNLPTEESIADDMLRKHLAREAEKERRWANAVSDLEFALARIAELEARLAWHKVSEGLPTDGQMSHLGVWWYITLWRDGSPTTLGWATPDAVRDALSNGEEYEGPATHWREIGPLPAAPNEAGK